jgi:hypothetical protein
MGTFFFSHTLRPVALSVTFLPVLIVTHRMARPFRS